MDAQTVVAVCELLLVVVALIDLVGRRDEGRTVLGQQESRSPLEGKTGLVS